LIYHPFHKHSLLARGLLFIPGRQQRMAHHSRSEHHVLSISDGELFKILHSKQRGIRTQCIRDRGVLHEQPVHHVPLLRQTSVRAVPCLPAAVGFYRSFIDPRSFSIASQAGHKAKTRSPRSASENRNSPPVRRDPASDTGKSPKSFTFRFGLIILTAFLTLETGAGLNTESVENAESSPVISIVTYFHYALPDGKANEKTKENR
jgi:hypothetical protein